MPNFLTLNLAKIIFFLAFLAHSSYKPDLFSHKKSILHLPCHNLSHNKNGLRPN